MLALLGGPALLSAFTVYGKCPTLLGEISVVNSEIPPGRAGPPLKQILTKNLTETRDLGKEG